MLKAPITVKGLRISHALLRLFMARVPSIYCFFIKKKNKSESLYMQLPAEREVKIQLRKT